MKKQKLSILFTSLMMVVLSAAWGCPVGAVPTDADPSDPVRREVMVLESGGGATSMVRWRVRPFFTAIGTDARKEFRCVPW